MLTKEDYRWEWEKGSETQKETVSGYVLIMWRDNRKHSVVCPVLHVPADVSVVCGVSAAYSDAFQQLDSAER